MLFGKKFSPLILLMENWQMLLPFVADVKATVLLVVLLLVVDGIPLSFAFKADGIALFYTLAGVITNVWQF